MVRQFKKNTGRKNVRANKNNREEDKKIRKSPRNDKRTKISSKSTERKGWKNKSKTFAKKKKATSQRFSTEMRLNRFIAHAGICSRREADQYITAGLVTVNGKIVKELGTKVLSSDDVRFDGRKLNPEKKVYILLNKPKGFVTTTDDSQGEKTALSLIKNSITERVYPVGRMEKETTGLILFTNDGDLSKRLTNPKHKIQKLYQVTLNKPLTKNDFQKLSEGVDLEDGTIIPNELSFINPNEKRELGIELLSGKNRLVHRMFELLGYQVQKLDRVLFAGLTKKNLPRGKWRELSDKEIIFLKMK